MPEVTVKADANTLLTESLPMLSCAVACAPRAGDADSGDLSLVRRTDRGVLLAVMDGAGNGTEAVKVARMAAGTVQRHTSEGVIPLIRLCHEALTGTRGAVISLISVDAIENTITWAGVGSIVGMLLRNDVSAPHPYATIPLQAGVVGYRLPRLQAAVMPIARGDLLVLATDGIRRDFVQAFSPDDEPASIAEYILSNYPRGNDSRLVLVARYLGLRE